MRKSIKNARSIRGQIALITVLTSVVVFTIGVATASRMTSDIRIATRVEEAAQTDALAEAGIEHGLLAIKNGSVTFGVPTFETYGALLGEYTRTIRKLPQINIHSYDEISVGNAQSIWLTNNPNNPLDGSSSYFGEMTVSWEPVAADVEISIYYYDVFSMSLKTKRWYQTVNSPIELDFDPSSATPALGTNDRAILMRIRPVNVSIIPTITIPSADFSQFPSQGHQIEVVSRRLNGEVQRKILFNKWYDDYPTYFDFVLYSDGAVRND